MTSEAITGNGGTAAGSRRQTLEHSGALPFGLRRAEGFGLAAVLALAGVLDFYNLASNGFANTYYAAAVRSMSLSLHNFLFSSFDPGGYVTIDKPPIGFWFQVFCVKLFGFHGTSLLFPQALAGVVSVALVFFLVRRQFGSLAGLTAALALTLTPISVATNRNNTIDSLLALTLLLAATALLFALEQGKLRWLVLSMALVGIGFNIKMAEALVALPAFGLAYFVAAPIAWRTRIMHLALAGSILLVVALSWVTAVDLVPASQRPYVGSSQHNSELELALGYNGINRLLPRRLFGPRPARPAQPRAAAPVGSTTATTQRSAARVQSAPAFRGPFGAQNDGLPQALRLFGAQLGSQLSWLLPLAAIGLVVAAVQEPLRRRPSQRQRALLVWGGWFVCCGVLFTFDQAARPYYMVTFAPATAALVGIGVAALWRDYRSRSIKGWLLPLALAGTAFVETFILRPFAGWNGWLAPALLAVALIAAVLLALLRLPRLRLPRQLTFTAATAGVLALFLPCALWSAATILRPAPGGMPTAGPQLAGFGFGLGAPRAQANARPAPNPGTGVDPKLLSYLQSHDDGTQFLVGTTNAQSAAPFILQTGQPVMALGGFTGSDPILTPDELAQSVKAGRVRYFLVPGAATTNPMATPRGGAADSPRGGAGGGPQGGAAAPQGRFQRPAPDVTQAFEPPAGAPTFAGDAGAFPGFFGRGNGLQSWVTANCAPVPAGDWRSSAATSAGTGFGFGFGGGNQQLYDCDSV